MYTILKEPLIVLDKNTQVLPPNFKPIAIVYGKNLSVFSILKNSVENYLLEKIEKNNNYISIYNGDWFYKRRTLYYTKKRRRDNGTNIKRTYKKI